MKKFLGLMAIAAVVIFILKKYDDMHRNLKIGTKGRYYESK